MGNLKPAQIVAEHEHHGWTWRAYQVGKHQFDVYRQHEGGRIVFVRTYATEFFAKRRCKKGAES